MAAVKITINGVICDLYGRTITGPVKIVGEAMYSGLGVGGGPIEGGGDGGLGIWGPTDPRPGYGPPEGGPPGKPPGIWGGPIDPYPDHGLPGRPPSIWGPTDPRPGYGPVAPQPPLPPGVDPPEPGDPTTPFPPPQGAGGWPVQPIQPPPYIVVNYPGVGPVIVAPPAQDAEPK